MIARLAIVAGATLLASCSSVPSAPQARLTCNVSARESAPAPVIQSADGVAQPIPANAVIYQDRALERLISVHQLYARESEVRTVEVHARLANCTAEEVQVRLRASFLDAEFAPIEPTSAWQTVFIPGGGLAAYDEHSLLPGATHYLLEMDSVQ